MEFLRQEYWGSLPFFFPGDLPDPGIEPTSPAAPALEEGFSTTAPPGKHSIKTVYTWGFPGGSVVKNLPANAGDTADSGLISGLERSPVEGNGNLLQYSCLENPMDRGVWWATVHGITKE